MNLNGKYIEILPGDMFAVRSPSLVGKGIRFFEKVWSHDGEANYNHSGIFLEENKTFEALWEITSKEFNTEYAGKQVVVARYTGTPTVPIDQVLKALVAQYLGVKYPWWRIILHTIPFLAKLNFTKIPVCSELVALFEHKIGVRHAQWAGTNPDTLVDEWRRWQNFEIIGEGIAT